MTRYGMETRNGVGLARTTAWLVGGVLLGLALIGPGPLESEARGESFQNRRTLDPWNTNVNRPLGRNFDRAPAIRQRTLRHEEFIQAGVPLEYRSRRSPYAQAGKVITEGRRLYYANCAACHGRKGRGDGDAGMDLLPSPALLSELMEEQGSVDEYLMWSIAEGGDQFGTSMPAFKDRLLENDIWRIVGYMRAGFPPEEGQ